jgi:UDP-2,4-diacetamido-2,4,6-trideoxy-beta-L-altropyranose hydrolase
VAVEIDAVADDATPVRLRPATRADGELMLAWQQAPGARRFAHDPHPPERDAHFAWLERRLADAAAGPFEIILAANEPVGVLRFDLEPDVGVYRVSILVVPEAQGRGVALAALRLGAVLMRGKALKAEVLSGNAASHRLFQKAGYVQVGPEEYRAEA